MLRLDFIGSDLGNVFKAIPADSRRERRKQIDGWHHSCRVDLHEVARPPRIERIGFGGFERLLAGVELGHGLVAFEDVDKLAHASHPSMAITVSTSAAMAQVATTTTSAAGMGG